MPTLRILIALAVLFASGCGNSEQDLKPIQTKDLEAEKIEVVLTKYGRAVRWTLSTSAALKMKNNDIVEVMSDTIATISTLDCGPDFREAMVKHVYAAKALANLASSDDDVARLSHLVYDVATKSSTLEKTNERDASLMESFLTTRRDLEIIATRHGAKLLRELDTIPRSRHPVVAEVFKSSIAQNAGIRVGDVLLAYDGVVLADRENPQQKLVNAVKARSGSKGTFVMLRVLRKTEIIEIKVPCGVELGGRVAGG